MEAVVQPRPITAEEFWELSHQLDTRAELVNGRITTLPPSGPEHGRIDRKLALPQGSYVEAHDLGEVYLSTSFTLRRDPDLTRGPDQAFVSARRIAENPPPERGF